MHAKLEHTDRDRIGTAGRPFSRCRTVRGGSQRFLASWRLSSRLNDEEACVARRTIFVSDLSGDQISDGKAARITVNFQDARKGAYVLDVTEQEAEELGAKGAKQARRGRPKTAAG